MDIEPPPALQLTHRSARKLINKLKRNLQDASLVVLGDSTGNDSNEWVYLLALWLALIYPTHTVVYRLWDDTTRAYGAPVTISTGTGSRTLTIYNASVAGRNCYYPQVAGFSTMIPVSPDLVIINHGHNEQPHLNEADGLLFAGRYSALIMRISTTFQDPDIFSIIQNPQTVNSYQQMRAQVILDVASQMGIGVIEALPEFLAYPNWATMLMADSVHPGSLGSGVTLMCVQRIFTETAIGPAAPIIPSGATVNLLKNGDFGAYPTNPGAPTDWTVLGTGVSAQKDQTNWETAGWGCQVTSGAGAAGWLQQSLDTTKYPISAFQGRYASLLVRVRRPNGNAVTSGRIQLYDGIASGTSMQIATTQSDPSFYWEWVTIKVSSNATTLRAYLYADSGTTGGQVATFDRAILVRGRYPRDLYL